MLASPYPHMTLGCDRTKWRGREAWVLRNDLVELTHLTGGGHIVDFHFRRKPHNINPFWIPAWKTLEPFDFEPDEHSKIYGSPETGKLLCGIAGHSLCLDLFGMPSPEESRCGGTIHGEAAVLRWRAARNTSTCKAELRLSVELPRAGLRFRRSLLLRGGESVVHIRESVKNEREVDHFFQWQEHAVLGYPFLKDSVIELPGARGWTSPQGYEERELVKSNREFVWPHARQKDRGRADLRQPLARVGTGFVAAVEVAPNRTDAFACALNLRMQLVIGYCFRRQDFPWITLWEENCARRYSPWQGLERTRGLEFGASPLPLNRRDNFMIGPRFGTPTLAHVPAKTEKTVRYVLFLAQVPEGTRSIRNIVVGQDSLKLDCRPKTAPCSVTANAIRDFFRGG